MSDTTDTLETTRTPSAALPYYISLPLLGLGPVLTARIILANQSRSLLQTPHAMSFALLVLVGVVWSPLPLSVPTSVLQFARDAALADWGRYTLSPRNALRALVLVPYLIVSPRSAVRWEMTTAVLGWLAGLALCAPHLGSVHTLSGIARLWW